MRPLKSPSSLFLEHSGDPENSMRATIIAVHFRAARWRFSCRWIAGRRTPLNASMKPEGVSEVEPPRRFDQEYRYENGRACHRAGDARFYNFLAPHVADAASRRPLVGCEVGEGVGVCLVEKAHSARYLAGLAGALRLREFGCEAMASAWYRDTIGGI